MTINAPITITPIQITAPVTFGMIGPQGPNAVTSATTSNGTATLSLAGITIAAFTSGHVVTVTTGGAFTTTSRSGIDTRSTFPNADVTAATSAGTASTLVKRSGTGGASFSDVVYSGTTGIGATGTSISVAGITFSGPFKSVTLNAPSGSHTNSLPSTGGTLALETHSHGNITNAGAIGSTADLVVTTGTSGILTTSSRSGIDSRTSFPPSSHTHTASEITDFAAAVAATAPQAHTHGNITNAGAIGSTADLAVITGASGVLTTTSRSGIDTRSTFPNDDVTAATHLATRGTLVRRNATNGRILIENLQVATEYGTVTILGNSTTERPELNLFAGALLFSSTCELTGGAGKFSFPSGDPLVSYKLRCAPIVCSGPASAAVMGQDHIVIASHIFSDPTPSEGAWFRVIVRNGTATVGGTAYSTSGTIIERSYHSGAWANRVYNETPVLGANVSTALAIAANGSGGFVTDTGTVTLTNKTLTNPTVTNFTETVVSGGNTGTSQTIALTNGTVQTYTLTGNCTFTMPTATAGKSFTVLLNTGTGGFTATFTGVRWSGNVAPAITATASRRDIVSFIADGSAWYGSIIQNFTP